MSATTMVYGTIRKGKVIQRPKPRYMPLKGDTATGIGERAKSALGGNRKER